MKYAEVILDINNKNLNRIFHYIIPEEFKQILEIGMRVYVPFGKGNRLREGYVIGFCEKVDIEEKLLKKIAKLPDKYPIFSFKMIELAKFMADKYYANLAECLQCIMPKIVNNKTSKYVSIDFEKKDIDLLLEAEIKKNTKQSLVLEFLKERTEPILLEELKKILKITISPIQTLIKKGLLKAYDIEVRRNLFDIGKYSKTEPFKRTPDQEKAISKIIYQIEKKDRKPILLYGVTGSGKTEVYLQIIEEVIKSGRQAIVLVPEISLTPQTFERFISRFGNLVSFTHSRLSFGERFEQWQKAKNGEISIIVGARSAIFTPFENLGIIIIDEEHESTYKSESTPKYSTIEIAEYLAEINDANLILGSATPSIESYYKVETLKYNFLAMESRVNNTFPLVNIIDMRKELENGNKSIFSIPLYNAILDNLKNNMQTILFLNRRGHSTFISCRKCGYVMECTDCNVNYTYHLKDNKLLCHYCNKTEKVPKICPSCNSEYIKYFGIGTQRVEDEIKKYFKDARVIRMDADTTSRKNSHKTILEKFKNHEADILIGTQMIAKGLDFPKVCLVGVIAGDLSLNLGGYNSSEKAFQILTQVSGRAGRGNLKGQVFIQTYNPEHYSIKFAKENDYFGFYKKEIKEREVNFYPPFSNIFLILIYGEDEEKVKKVIYKLSEIMLYYNKKVNFQISCPAKAIIYKIKNNYRYKIMIKDTDEERLKKFVLYCVSRLNIHINIDNITINLTLNPNYVQ